MRRLVAISIGLLICGATIDPPGFAQDPQLDVSRKIVSRVVPVYPELARTMNLQGTVSPGHSRTKTAAVNRRRPSAAAHCW